MAWLEARTLGYTSQAPTSHRVWVAFHQVDSLSAASADGQSYVAITCGPNVYAHPTLFATQAEAEAFIESDLLDNVR